MNYIFKPNTVNEIVLKIQLIYSTVRTSKQLLLINAMSLPAGLKLYYVIVVQKEAE